MTTSIIIIGAGGHSRVLLHTLRQQSYVHIEGILELDCSLYGKEIAGVKVIGGLDSIKQYPPKQIQLVNAVGAIDTPNKRIDIYKYYKALGYQFFSVIAESAHIANDVLLGEGVQIMAGVIIQPGCTIGDNVILNTRTTIDHDCHIHSHAHLAPGVVISGGVTIGDASHIGTGAIIIQGIMIGMSTLVGAGAVVIRDVADRQRVAGVPATSIVAK